MLSLYRRHKENCAHASDRISKKCRCSIWLTGTLLGKPYRKSAKTRNWEAAEKERRRLESGGDPEPQVTVAVAVEGTTLARAIEVFTTDLTSQDRAADTIRKYRLLFDQLAKFAEARGFRTIEAFNREVLVDFRASWTEGAATRNKKLDRLKAFFNFCHDAGWLPKKLTKSLKPAKTIRKRVEPFSGDDQARILAKPQTARIRAFVHTMYHSGLRISDCCFLKPDDFDGNCIRRVNRKNQVEIYVPIPPALKADLDRIPLTGGYYFLIGESENLHTQTDAWRSILNDLYPAKDFPGFHPHRFRHTRVVEWLAAGITLEEISGMIGTSVKVLEKHYASFAPARQQVVIEKLAQVWGARPKLVRVK
jgi:integrase